MQKLIAILDPANSSTFAAKLGTAAVVIGALIALLTKVQEILCSVGVPQACGG